MCASLLSPSLVVYFPSEECNECKYANTSPGAQSPVTRHPQDQECGITPAERSNTWSRDNHYPDFSLEASRLLLGGADLMMPSRSPGQCLHSLYFIDIIRAQECK